MNTRHIDRLDADGATTLITNDLCRATFTLGDDYGDNDVTFHCTKDAGHPGNLHGEEGMSRSHAYSVSWHKHPDEIARCARCRMPLRPGGWCVTCQRYAERETLP